MDTQFKPGNVASSSIGQLFVILGPAHKDIDKKPHWYGIAFDGNVVVIRTPKFVADNLNEYYLEQMSSKRKVLQLAC